MDHDGRVRDQRQLPDHHGRRPTSAAGSAAHSLGDLATAALPDRLGTATAHIAATGIGIILLAIWPVLTVSLDPAMPWPRRARWAIGVSGLLFGLVVWLCCDAWSGINVGLSERTAATAEMLWPLVVVVSARRHLPAAIALPADISAYPRSEKGVSQYISRPRIGALCRAASFVRGVTGMTSNEWQPVVRVGEPRFIAGSGNRIKVELKTRGWLSRDWRRYFGSQVSYQQLDARYCSFLCWDEVQQIEGSCAHDDAEHYVEMIDAAIHYANSKFASDVLPRPVTPASNSARGLAQVRHRQAALDHLAKKLARPD
jgi:hypothetical protein